MGLLWPEARDLRDGVRLVDVRSRCEERGRPIAHSAQHAPTWHFCMCVYEPVLGCIVELDNDLWCTGHPKLIYFHVVQSSERAAIV